MAFNTAITSKYKPFTYEEIVKPLENYWKEYDKQEDALVKLQTDAASLQSYLDSLPHSIGDNGEIQYSKDDQKLVDQYNKYLTNLNSLSEQLASSGLNYDLKTRIKELPIMYNSQVAPMASAIEKRSKFINSIRATESSGDWTSINTNSLGLSPFIDGTLPEYSTYKRADMESSAKTLAENISDSMPITELPGNKYSKGIKATDYINGKLPSSVSNALTRAENEIFGEFKRGLGLSDEAFNQRFSDAEQHAIRQDIKNYIAKGLKYTETAGKQSPPNKDPKAAQAIFTFPIVEDTILGIDTFGKPTKKPEYIPKIKAYDEEYNLRGAALVEAYNKKHPEDQLTFVKAESNQDTPGNLKHPTEPTINLYIDYHQKPLLMKDGVFLMPIQARDKKGKLVTLDFLRLKENKGRLTGETKEP